MQRKNWVNSVKYAGRLSLFFSMHRKNFTLVFQSNAVFNSPPYTNKSCTEKFS